MKESKVNEILKKLREETGYSQEQLANMLDLSRTSVAHIEM
jgi:DNA-binding XRE family transcriptional regulator